MIHHTILAMKLKLDALYNGKNYLIVNKPSNVHCQPPDMNFWFRTHPDPPLVLMDMLRESNFQDEDVSLKPVHRLDNVVTGGVLIAKGRMAAANFSKNLKKGGNYGFKMVRKYVALVSRTTKYLANEGTLKSGGMITHYRKIDEHCLALQLHTGKKHQIRRHLSQVLDRPILNDITYGGIRVEGINNQIALHSAYIKTKIGFQENHHMIPIVRGNDNLWSQYVDHRLQFRQDIQEILAQDWGV